MYLYKITNGSCFLAHRREPVESDVSFTWAEVKKELSGIGSRFYLKRQVWRNMQKIREQQQGAIKILQSRITSTEPLRYAM